MGLFDRVVVEGCGTQRLSPEVEAECYRVYMAEKGTRWGMSDKQIMAYLEEDGARRRIAHLIDPYPNSNMETLH
jgi:hypothetical protein